MRWTAGLCALALFMPLAFGTSPLPPPFHRYVVSGRVSHRDGSPAAEVILVLFARTARDTALHMPRSPVSTDEQPIAVSTNDGQFVLTARTETIAESLAVGAIADNRPLVRNAAFHPDSSLAYATRRKGTNTTDVGCAGCGTDPATFEYTVSYTTNISSTLTID